MNDYIPGLLFIGLGILMGILTMKGFAIHARSGWIASVIFTVLGLAICAIMHFHAYKWYAAIIGVPFFGFMAFIGVSLLKDCLTHTGKTRGTLLKFEPGPWGRSERTYRFLFQYEINGKRLTNSTTDSYPKWKAEKKCQPQNIYTLYFNPKNPESIRLRRFEGLLPGIMALLLGISGIYAMIRVIMGLPL